MSRKEFQVPKALEKVYEQRSRIWDIKTTKDLENLMETSEREFYYYLTYAYIKQLDLSNILSQDSLVIRLGVSMYYQWLKTFGYEDICKYLNTYMVADESTVQARKVARELQMTEYREKIENDR